jgi:hypothetical protein
MTGLPMPVLSFMTLTDCSFFYGIRSPEKTDQETLVSFSKKYNIPQQKVTNLTVLIYLF